MTWCSRYNDICWCESSPIFFQCVIIIIIILQRAKPRVMRACRSTEPPPPPPATAAFYNLNNLTGYAAEWVLVENKSLDLTYTECHLSATECNNILLFSSEYGLLFFFTTAVFSPNSITWYKVWKCLSCKVHGELFWWKVVDWGSLIFILCLTVWQFIPPHPTDHWTVTLKMTLCHPLWN